MTALSTDGLYPAIIANDYGNRSECGADLDDFNLSAYVLPISYTRRRVSFCRYRTCLLTSCSNLLYFWAGIFFYRHMRSQK